MDHCAHKSREIILEICTGSEARSIALGQRSERLRKIGVAWHRGITKQHRCAVNGLAKQTKKNP